jgi:hypothetical protein
MAEAERRTLPAWRIDKLYGLRNGTASRAARAGLVKFRERPGRGRYRITVQIDVRDAELEWGARRQVSA